MADGRDRPNVLVFMADQLRHDHLSCAGNDVVETPNVDTLAADGVRCERAYVANPLCMPARASLFTGLPPREHGVRTNGIPLPEDAPHLVEAFRAAGYRTHAAGKLHHHNYSLPLDHTAALLERGEMTLDEIPSAFQERVEEIREQLAGGDAVRPDAPAAEAFPESAFMWNSGRLESLPEPYYGFESTDFVGAHGDGVYGEYRNWLAETHPESLERLARGHPDNESAGADDAWRWALPPEHHYDHWVADRAREFLRTAGEDPFFLFCSFPDPHHPYAAPEPWASEYDPAEVALPTRREGELDDLPPFYRTAHEDDDVELSGLLSSSRTSDAVLREMVAITYGMVSFVDHQVGRVLETLAAEGLHDDTIVLFCSDHGDMMGDHWMLRKGPFHFQGLLRTPMVWRWPGELPAGEVVEGLVSALDVAPTLYDLCGVADPTTTPYHLPETLEEPDALPGHSLEAALERGADTPRDGLVIENDEDYLGLRVRSYVTDRYTLTVYPGEPYGELFDRAEDPEELHNRWDDPDYAEVKTRLYQEFLAAYVESDGALPRRLSHAA